MSKDIKDLHINILALQNATMESFIEVEKNMKSMISLQDNRITVLENNIKYILSIIQKNNRPIENKVNN